MALVRSTRAILRRGDISYVIVQGQDDWRIDKIVRGRLVGSRRTTNLPPQIMQAIGGKSKTFGPTTRKKVLADGVANDDP